MKKIFTFFLALTASVGTIFGYTWNLTDGVLTIDGIVDVRDCNDSTCFPWHSYRRDINKIIIGDSVTGIGFYAFANCTNLTSVIIGKNVVDDIKFSFGNCPSLTSVTLNSNSLVNRYHHDDSGFDDIFGPQVTEYIIGDGATNIGANAFNGCTGLTSVTIPNSVTSIGEGAFSNCSGLTSITIPNSVTSIGKFAFNNCTSLTNLIIPDKVTSIGVGAFAHCTGITSIEIPNGVTRIEGYSFRHCNNLISITIPDGVTSLGNSAFDACTSLTSINIPSSVTSIGSYAFYGCSGLTSITIPDAVTSVADFTFQNCTGLTSVTIPNNVTSIGWYAFNGCTGLTSITIGNNVTTIERMALYGCNNIKSVTWNAKNGPSGNGKGEFDEYSSFFGNQVESWLFGDSVEVIPASSCYKMNKLSYIYIPNSVKSIGKLAFYKCTGLTTLTIGNSVESIRRFAFVECIKLKSIYNFAAIPQSITDSFPFDYVDTISCVLYVPANSIELYKKADVWCEFKNILPIFKDEVTDVTIAVTDSTANIIWPKVNNAHTSELIIRDTTDNVIDSLIFNAEGRLLSSTNNMPSKDNSFQQSQLAGFEYTINNLRGGTTYRCTVTAKNEEGAPLYIKTYSFTTTSEPQAIESVSAIHGESTKILRDGQILILRGDKTYTVTGQEVK